MRISFCITLLIFLTLIFTISSAGKPGETFPDCGYGCVASDTTLQRAWLGDASGTPINSIACSSPTTVYLWADVWDNTGTNRYCLYLWATITSGGSSTTVKQKVPTSLYYSGYVLPGHNYIPIHQFTWSCQPLSVYLNLLAWDTTPTTTCPDTAGMGCNDYYQNSKCSKNYDVPIDRPQMSLTKTSTNYGPGNPATIGDTINYQIKLTNTGNVPLKSISVSDPLLGSLSGPTGDSGTSGVLEVGEVWTYTGSYAVRPQDVCLEIKNTATANAKYYPGGGATGFSLTPVTASYSVPTRPSGAQIAVTKTYQEPYTTDSPASLNDVITYQVAVTNPGQIPLFGLSVTDTLLTLSGPAGDNGDGILQSGETWLYSGTFTVIDVCSPVTNTVTASGHVCSADYPDQVSSTATATVPVRDDALPVITGCPTDISQINNAGICGAIVTWTPPAATDNCGEVDLSSDHQPGETFPVGTTTVTYTATDDAGNSVSCSFDVTVTDDEDPAFTCPDDITQTADEGTCSATVTWTPPAATDNCGEVELSSDHEPAETFPVGTTTVTYTATDNAGNSVSCSFDVTVTDDEDPSLTCPDDITQTADEGTCSATVTWTPPTATDNCGEVDLSSDHQPGETFPVGTTTVTYTATDNAGNSVSCSFDVTVTDDENPSLTCPDDITQTADEGTCGAIVTWTPPTATDNCGEVDLSSDHEPGETFPVGTTTVTYTATDNAGNSVSCSFDVTVTDDENPSLTCPDDITQTADEGTCGAIVTWTPPAATDNCGEVDLSSDHEPAETFPVGTTTVTYTATDNAGNSVSCSFDVTVTDDEDPSLTCPDDITQTADEGTCGAIVTWTPPAATDNCGEVELSSDHEPAETFPVGTTTVTYTATDNAGNSVSCSFDVTVTDDEDPSLTCPDDITQTADEGTCGATVTWTPPAATDNCGEVELSSDHEPAETFPVGTTTVTYTATDNAGNSVSCSFDVTVTDDEDPALTCPEDIETNTDEGVCNAQATVTEPTADDNCKIGSVQGVRSDGQALNDPYPIGTTTITWTVTDSSGHQTSCDQKVTVTNANEAVWVSAGPDQTVCSDSPVQLAGTASDQSTPTWTTRGDGSFQNPGSSSTTYYPGAGDLASGSVILTLSAIPAIACVEEVSDEILINIDPCIADVDLEKTDSPDPVIIPVNSETQLTYTVTVTNSGPSDAHDVVVTDTLPNGVDYDTADASVGTFSYDSNSRTISWRIGDLAREASPPVLTITVKVPYSIKDLEIEALSNTACLTHADADPDATDCSTATTEIIVEQEEPQIASIDVTKEASPTVAYPGDTVTFTITVSNNGEAILSPLVVEDTLPLGLIYQSDDFSGSRDISGQTITWTIDSLSPQDSPVVIHVSARVDESLQLALNTMSAEPEHIQQEPRLHVMTDSGPADGEPLAGEEIIQALLRNCTVLELRLERMIAERDSFNRSGGLCQELPSAAGGNLSVCSYTNMTDGRQLLEILDQNETLIRSEFSRTSQDDQLLSLYGPAGRSDLYTSQSTRQSLRIDYDMPAAGQKTLTIRDYQTGDTLVQVLDIAGELLSQQYRKTPGLLVPSRYLENRVKATGTDPDGLPVEGSASATVEVGLVPLPGISIDKTVTPESARPGEEVAYRIAVRNTGNVPLVDIIVSDTMLDLELDPFDLDVGEEKAFEIPYLVRQEDKSPLVNLATVVGFPLQGGDAVTDEDEATLLLAEGLFTKTATPRVVGPGDLVTYTITFHATQSGTYKIVDQYPRGVAFVSASPQPTQGDNIWVISLGQDKTVKIEILVQVAEIIGNTTFLMDQSVQGEGFVNVNNDLCTKPVILINQAFLYRQEGTAWVLYDSVSANPAKVDVQVGPPSTCASVREHGSGSYDSSDQISYRNKNSSISWNKSLSATYHPTSFDLPKNRSLSYSTKWIEKQRTQNLGLAASTNEEYTYSNRIDRESSLLMDENGTTLLVDSDFEGMAHFGAMKLKENLTNKSRWEAEPVLESREDYLGSFRVYRQMDAYGESVVANRSISGQGLVSVDQRVGESQRTHESGSGSYQVEELIDTSTSYIAKDIELAHDRSSYQLTESRWVNASGRWSEGMWSKSNPSGSGSFGGTYIGEEFHYLDRLQKETKAPGLNEMSTKASFKGTADFKAVKSDRARNHSGMDAVAYDRYVGEYEIERQIRFTGVARYDQPHLYIQKDVHVDLSSSTLADYRILVENDGNVDFAPVQVMDLFPPGTEFVDSSIRPSALQDGQANWTLRNLGVGEAVEIRLRLNITDEEDNLVNRVLATGTHEDGQTVASNFSAVQLSWLTCCPPQLDARKTANVVNNTTMVLYRISLTNREDYTMVAFIQDHLPDGMSLVSSTVDPSYQHGSEVAWTIVDLQPGETRVIEYLSSAPGDGIYANSAHVEVYSVDGPDAASADLVARVEVGGTGRVASSRSGWHPPTCFGLSCPASLQAPDWVPCSACGRSEPTPDYACPDCTPV